jgi:hypothetical protein
MGTSPAPLYVQVHEPTDAQKQVTREQLDRERHMLWAQHVRYPLIDQPTEYYLQLNMYGARSVDATNERTQPLPTPRSAGTVADSEFNAPRVLVTNGAPADSWLQPTQMKQEQPQVRITCCFIHETNAILSDFVNSTSAMAQSNNGVFF